MQWHFSALWLFIGLLVIAGGALTVIFYNKVADAFFEGVKNYGKTKLGGLIAIGVGLLLMTNTHTMILTMLVDFFFKR